MKNLCFGFGCRLGRGSIVLAMLAGSGAASVPGAVEAFVPPSGSGAGGYSSDTIGCDPIGNAGRFAPSIPFAIPLRRGFMAGCDLIDRGIDNRPSMPNRTGLRIDGVREGSRGTGPEPAISRPHNSHVVRGAHWQMPAADAMAAAAGFRLPLP